MTDTAVAAIIPAKDEAARIAATVDAVRSLDGVDLVVVVDDGSSDATADPGLRARRSCATRATGQGRGDDVRGGIRARVEFEEGRVRPSAERRALLFVDGDLEASAANLDVPIPPVASGQADMTIATLPRRRPPAAARFRRPPGPRRHRGVHRLPGGPAAGHALPLPQAFDAATPLSRGWGVEVGLTIDVLLSGMQVLEVPCELHHRVSGSDWRGQLHRARQYRDVALALAYRRLRRVTG